MAALLFRSQSSTCVRVSPARDASRLSSKQNNQPRFFPRGAWSARRPLKNAIVSATSASSSFSSAQQAAVPTGMGEGSRLGGGPRQMGGDDGSQMVEKGRKIRKKEEVLKELLKMRDQLEELFAGLSLEENFQTSRPLDNRITDARSTSSLQGTPGQKVDQEVLEQLLSLKHFLDMLNNLIESFDPAAEADSALVCLNNALQFYHRRRAEGMPASTVILNFLLAISTQVDHNKSMELYALMLKEGLQPDFTTIGCLCLSACFAGDIISIKRILLDSAGWEDQENHEDEEEDFLSSTTLYYNKFIDLCAASDSQANVQAEQTSTEQVQVQLEMAWRLYHGLEADKNARPDAETFNILIGVNLKAGDHEGALQAYKLMSASGFARDLEPELWNKLIHAVAAVPSAPAYVAYGPDLDTYVGLMAVCARDGDAAWAMALRREMEDGGVEVTGEVLRALMAMQRKAGMWEAAVETFKEMQTKAVLSTDEDAAWGREFLKEAAEKVRPNAKTLNLLIEASVEAGYHEGAVRAYKLMAANGLAHELNPVFWSKLTQFARTVIAPSTPTNTANEADTPPPVLQLLSEATESGCVDPEVFNLLIETSLQAGDPEGALRAYKLMSASGFACDLDPPFWNKLIHAVAAVPSAPAFVAYGCYDGMQRWGPEPDEATYQGLMAVCARDGDAARAIALRREMEDGGVEVTAVVYTALINAQGRAGEWEAAVETFNEMQGSTKGEMEHPHQPSMDTYTRLFDACFGPDGADPVIRDAMQEGKTLKFTPALQAAVSIFREAAAKGVFPPALTADPFTLYVVDCTRPVAAAALLSLLLHLASSSTAGCNDASWLQNLVIVTATLYRQSQAADEAPPQEPCPDLQGTMEAMLQALGLKGERLHGTSALQGLCVDREDLRLWLNTQAASVFLA
ncbi:unnamed protein product [Closterium sp. NIES-65]|nr:unnamed protein product [Closterium sp. NIES-65]